MARIDYTRKARKATSGECKRHAFVARCEAAHAALVKAGLASGQASTVGADALPCTCR